MLLVSYTATNLKFFSCISAKLQNILILTSTKELETLTKYITGVPSNEPVEYQMNFRKSITFIQKSFDKMIFKIFATLCLVCDTELLTSAFP